jgi:hypothetical protein
LSDDEILSRLLTLNLARAAEEAKAPGGLLSTSHGQHLHFTALPFRVQHEES